MRTPRDLPTAGSFLRWGGLLAVVLAIAGGILGMHVIGGAQTPSVAHASMDSSVTATAVTAHSTPVAGHGVPADGMVAGQGVHEPTNTPAMCGCTSSGCGASMEMHGACVPSFGPAVLSVPLPGMSTQVHAGTAFINAPGPNSQDRIPDPPSLNQLSISRT